MNWLFTTFRSGRRMQQILEMFGIQQRRNNRNLMYSIVGLGLGAAALRFLRGRNINEMMAPVRNAIDEIDINNPIRQ